MTDLSIVIPCFNEEAVFPTTLTQLLALRGRMVTAGSIAPSSRLVFVDDGSADATWSLIEAAVAAGHPVQGIRLSRNRGHQNALLAGLLTAPGDAIVSIDADLQDDPEAMIAMVAHHHDGSDVVYGVRRRRDTDSWFKRITAGAFYALLRQLGTSTIPQHADYRLLSRRAVESLREFGEVNLYLRGIIPMLGYRSAIVSYDRSARMAGESKYPLRRMIALGIDAITSLSISPLRFISVLGILISLSSVALTVWSLVGALSGRTIPGWASTVLPIYFLGGVQLLGIGMIGEYVGKTYLESKRRPRYVIDRVIGS